MRKEIWYTVCGIILACALAAGCASAPNREVSGVLKSKTRADTGVYKGDN